MKGLLICLAVRGQRLMKVNFNKNYEEIAATQNYQRGNF